MVETEEGKAPQKIYGWAKEYEVELPSGAWVVLKPCNIFSMVRAGQIPKDLASKAADVAVAALRGKPVDLDETGKFFEIILQQCMVRPALAEVGMEHIPEGDINGMYSWLLGQRRGQPIGDLTPFRPGEGRPAAG
jgi:hypothetical protein